MAQFISPKTESKRRLAEIEEATGLIVQVPSAEYLLAMNELWKRPATAAEIGEATHDTESFGRNLRDWRQELRHVTSHKDFTQRITDVPALLREKLNDSGQCDAYLAAYIEWLCERHGVPTPSWLTEPKRVATKAWYDYPPLWQDSFAHAPAAFRRRGVFTRPEDVLSFRKGRPTKSKAHKRAKIAERQRQYRARIREKLERLNTLENS
ncbi:MAG: hypothetical protein ACI9ZV_000661 [Candidatus Azotimanducaceae bacterium]